MNRSVEEAIARLDERRAVGSTLGVAGTGRPGHGDDRSGSLWRVTNDHVIDAIKVALVTGRPLLIEGPSGTGKSSLATALANTLGYNYLEYAITSQTIARDLLYEIDHLLRLHDAQRLAVAAHTSHSVAAAMPDALAHRDPTSGNDGAFDDLLDSAAEYVRPGPLWWALSPHTAQATRLGRRNDPRRRPAAEGGEDAVTLNDARPAVLLLDEIDKADPDVPNNLLVPLGSGRFKVEDGHEVERDDDLRPLVMMTTNGERDFPSAFLRRCVRIELDFAPPAELRAIAVELFGDSPALGSDEVTRYAEKLLALLLPGRSPDTHAETNEHLSTAEYIDGVRALTELRPSEDDELWVRLPSILLSNER